jgi:cephalosporin-C deacetylase-like acetyl esterase
MAALDAFEVFIGQTYNYSGSLTDKINRVKIVKSMEEEDIMMGKLDTHGGSSGGGY